jgi:hypothetical protein
MLKILASSRCPIVSVASHAQESRHPQKSPQEL